MGCLHSISAEQLTCEEPQNDFPGGSGNEIPGAGRKSPRKRQKAFFCSQFGSEGDISLFFARQLVDRGITRNSSRIPAREAHVCKEAHLTPNKG